MGTDEPLPAAEPVGIVGGRPAPAPAAAVTTEPQDRFDAFDPGDGAMDRFVADYLDLLDGRLDAIGRCMIDSDIEGARVAVLSLESSSKMLGATVLAGRLTELRSQLDHLGPTPQRNALLALVEVAAEAFRRRLQSAAHR
ncbi:hypothetical protein GCM10022204_07530 [Microlunatus aurantiacus]|uniref:Hpt domain-containing protein n=1 Tax=Microlunatus aurantiacus TaxID=446786 RepID=A0ABP7CTZ0_9ACTN